MTWVPWSDAWHRALYGVDGFYRDPGGPAAHFATSAQGTPGAGVVFARAVVQLAHQRGLNSVVDVGCGRGELLSAVHELAPALVLANEWLDVVPCTVAEWNADRQLREVLVSPLTGQERFGPPLGASLAWCQRYWPETTRSHGWVEVGLTRDDAWADVLDRLRSGVAVAVDYGHTRGERPLWGRSRHTGMGIRSLRCRTAPATSRLTSRWTRWSTTSW